jgi:hypothetical protein
MLLSGACFRGILLSFFISSFCDSWLRVVLRVGPYAVVLVTLVFVAFALGLCRVFVTTECLEELM